MRLINCATLQFEEYNGKHIPPYLILSHTWEAYEISYKDYCGIGDLRLRPGPQAEKILRTCDVATAEGYGYVWIDTCCIDKSSSAELTEAINCMFKWYKRAARCIVYLSDFDSEDTSAKFWKCRWFTRGWTLQELIAPRDVYFYDCKWRFHRQKRECANILAQITGISQLALTSARFTPDSYSVAERMSWAAHRETTREEDLAYCLFGIFAVNLPLIYGEGRKAFTRLQEEIVKNTTDLTIFAWQEARPETVGLRGIFARAPSEFAHGKGIMSWPRINPEFAVTNRGLRIEGKLIPVTMLKSRGSEDSALFLSLWCRYSYMDTRHHLGIWLKKQNGYYFRVRADELPVRDETVYANGGKPSGLLYIVKDVEEEEEVEEGDEQTSERIGRDVGSPKASADTILGSSLRTPKMSSDSIPSVPARSPKIRHAPWV